MYKSCRIVHHKIPVVHAAPACRELIENDFSIICTICECGRRWCGRGKAENSCLINGSSDLCVASAQANLLSLSGFRHLPHSGTRRYHACPGSVSVSVPNSDTDSGVSGGLISLSFAGFEDSQLPCPRRAASSQVSVKSA